MKITSSSRYEQEAVGKSHSWLKVSAMGCGFYRSITMLIQTVLDFCTVLVANALAYGLYLELGLGKQHVDSQLYWQLNILTSLVAVLVFWGIGLYKESVGILSIEETRRLIRGSFYAAAGVLVASFLIREYSFSRITAVFALPFSLIFLVALRWTVSYAHAAAHRLGFGVRRFLIYGRGEAATAVAKRLLQNSQLGWIPVGFLACDTSDVGDTFRVTPGQDGRQLRVLGLWQDLEILARDHQVTDVVVIVSKTEKDEFVEHALLHCSQLGIQCHINYSGSYHLLTRFELHNIDGIPLVSPKVNDVIYYDILKRTIDLCVSLVVIVALLPLYLGIALWIKFDSPGPVFFRQKRIGLHGQEFTIYKFRTMYGDTPIYMRTPDGADDPRITRVGWFLRRTSLDEVPQLLNVVKGDMSLVGPRPEMPFIVETYTEHQRQRLTIIPGITGLWQISGDRALQIHENLEYDFYYIANRSLSLDLAILFQTAFSVIRGAGAW
jgi:putative colanic acid biosysnthesis UDP-glucose lipid carrier transferase